MASPDRPSPSSGSSSPFLSFTPKGGVSMGRSFENLVALANHQERLKEARKMVWRDKGEPVTELDDVWECVLHAARGGFRAGTMAFSIRACVNLVLALIRLRSVPKEIRFWFIRNAVFGSDSFRFGAMLGSFVSIYKLFINALPILFPKPSPIPSTHLPLHRYTPNSSTLAMTPTSTDTIRPLNDRRARLSLSAQATQILIRKKTRRWHAVLAGALAGGLAVMCEKAGRRTVIAQQLFVRGLQGSYNAFSTKYGIKIPHGDLIVFSFCCGQIMYAFLLRPDTLPRSYNTWINHAAKVPVECVRMNRGLVRDGKFDVADVKALIGRKDITSNNRDELATFLSNATSLTPSFGRRVVPCAAVHPSIDSCLDIPLHRFIAVFRWMLPIYGALHVVPKVLFKRKAFMKDPTSMLLQAAWGTTRSSAFLGVFVVIYQGLFCWKHNLHATLSAISPSSPLKLRQSLVDLLISKPSFFMCGVLCSLSLLVEEKRRRGELAMYVLPKGLESTWITARGRGWVFGTGQYGDMILTAIGMGMVMSTYQNDPQHLSGLVRRILYQFIGPN